MSPSSGWRNMKWCHIGIDEFHDHVRKKFISRIQVTVSNV